MKLVVLGGNAAGMSAASKVKRMDAASEVIVLEQTEEVSYGACGLPYYVSGLNPDLDLIRIRKAETFREKGIDLRLGCRAEGVDFQNKTVRYTDAQGWQQEESYDKLLISTGTSSRIPGNIPGIDRKGVYALKTLEDARLLKEAVQQAKSVVIVGGGYIGMELAEACILQKVPEIHVVEAMDRLMTTFDPEFGEAALGELERHGVKVHLDEKLTALEGDASVTAVVTDKGRYDADLVVISIGVVPNTQFLGDSIEKLKNGAIVTDDAMRTSVADVYAAGDCATVWHKLLDAPAFIALGTNANKTGRLAGESIMGKDISFKRALGTCMVRIADLEMAKTGLGETECKQNNIDYKVKTTVSKSHARYYPDPAELTVKICYRASDKVILGAQIMGRKEAAWRIDVFACAIDQGMTTAQLGFLDLGYAPPFSAVRDAVQIASNASK